MAKQVSDKTSKAAYSAPKLTEFGSVRNLTGGSEGMAADGGTMTMMATTGGGGSDRRFKENIVRIGTHPAGFGLYRFDYKPEFRNALGQGRQFGVMADEVEPIAPSTVARNAAGYAFVDYAQLGIARA